MKQYLELKHLQTQTTAVHFKMVTSDPSPMDIDTERETSSPQMMMKDTPMTNNNNNNNASAGVTPLSEEEEARQAIEKLHGDDLSARIEAASKLDTVAKTLGEERTRDVSFCFVFCSEADDTNAIYGIK